MPNESGVLLLEGNEPLEKDPISDKIIIRCEKVKRQELSYDETIEVRIFYWASFYGYNAFLRYMVE